MDRKARGGGEHHQRILLRTADRRRAVLRSAAAATPQARIAGEGSRRARRERGRITRDAGSGAACSPAPERRWTAAFPARRDTGSAPSGAPPPYCFNGHSPSLRWREATTGTQLLTDKDLKK
jgi:hypothetical protein